MAPRNNWKAKISTGGVGVCVACVKDWGSNEGCSRRRGVGNEHPTSGVVEERCIYDRNIRKRKGGYDLMSLDLNDVTLEPFSPDTLRTK